MSEAEPVRRADDPLQIEALDGLELPEGYTGHEGHLVVRTPTSTVQIMQSGGGALGQYLGSINQRHFDEDAYDLRNPELLPDKVSLKKYGEDAEVFAVDV